MLQDGEHALVVRRRRAADVRRDDDVLGAPQRVAVGQRLRVRHVEGGAADQARVQGLDQVRRVDDGPARDVGDEGLLGGEDLELGGREQVRRLVGQREGDDEEVEPRGEEGVELFLGVAREPLRGEYTLGIAEAGRGVGLVSA